MKKIVSAPFPMELRCFFQNFEKKSQSSKKYFFFKIGIFVIGIGENTKKSMLFVTPRCMCILQDLTENKKQSLILMIGTMGL